jgi:hypothetical protein
MAKSYKVFIPFIHEEYSASLVCEKLKSSGLCNVIRIDIHDKKEKTSQGPLRSLNHKYAFVTVRPILDTIPGQNFQSNLEHTQNTHIIHDDNPAKYWTLKPYLSIEQRINRGFSLLTVSSKKEEEDEKEEEEDEKEEEEDKKEEEEEEDEVPEWLHEPNDIFSLSNIQPLPKDDFPDCLRFISKEELDRVFHESQVRTSYFASKIEQQEIDNDYEEIMSDILRVQRIMQVF